MLNFKQFHLDMVRPGIMSYGIYPSESLKAKADLLPVMSFKTKVALLKEFPKGYGIGYNRTYITKKPTRIATIPVGYGDGYGGHHVQPGGGPDPRQSACPSSAASPWTCAPWT